MEAGPRLLKPGKVEIVSVESGAPSKSVLLAPAVPPPPPKAKPVRKEPIVAGDDNLRRTYSSTGVTLASLAGTLSFGLQQIRMGYYI